MIPADEPGNPELSTATEEGAAWLVRRLPRRSSVWLGAGLIGGAIVGLLLAGFMPKRYEATATVLVSPSKLGREETRATLGAAAYVELLRNAEVARRVVEQLQLDRTDGATPLRLLERHIVVRQLRGTELIAVTARLGDPTRAARAANLFAEEGVRTVDAGAVAEAAASVAQVAAQLVTARERLDAAQAELLSTRTTSQVELVEKDATALLEERAKLVTVELAIAAEHGRVQALDRQLVATPRTIAIERGLDRSTAMLEANRASGGSTALGVQMREEVLNPAHETIAEELSKARGRLAGLEESLRRMRGELKLGADALPRLSELYRGQAAVSRLSAEYDIAAKAYAALAEQHELAALQVLTRSATLRVVDAALTPERPSFPSRALFTVGGAILGCLLAFAVAILRQARVPAEP